MERKRKLSSTCWQDEKDQREEVHALQKEYLERTGEKRRRESDEKTDGEVKEAEWCVLVK